MAVLRVKFVHFFKLLIKQFVSLFQSDEMLYN